MFIFTSGRSALLGCPRCGIWIWLSLLANTFFWVYVTFFHEKTDKRRKHPKSAIFVWGREGGREREREIVLFRFTFLFVALLFFCRTTVFSAVLVLWLFIFLSFVMLANMPAVKHKNNAVSINFVRMKGLPASKDKTTGHRKKANKHWIRVS